MKIDNLRDASDWFEVLHTTPLSQTAAMTLAPGQATGAKAEAHEASEQILLLVSGELKAEIGEENLSLHTGDFVTIPPGLRHRFTNPGSAPAVTFNVYVPPEYAPGTKG